MTAQAHEYLNIEGKKTSMAFCPPLPGESTKVGCAVVLLACGIELWIGHSISFYAGVMAFASVLLVAYIYQRTQRHPRITKVALDENSDESIYVSTACYRGYIGSWKIHDGHFYLVGLSGRYQLEGEEPLLADWFSGVLRIPRGGLLEYVHAGFGSVYAEELHIKIVKGRVVSSRVKNNRKSKRHVSSWSDWPTAMREGGLSLSETLEERDGQLSLSDPSKVSGQLALVQDTAEPAPTTQPKGLDDSKE